MRYSSTNQAALRGRQNTRSEPLRAIRLKSGALLLETPEPCRSCRSNLHQNTLVYRRAGP
jgi:hypothetical protein